MRNILIVFLIVSISLVAETTSDIKHDSHKLENFKKRYPYIAILTTTNKDMLNFFSNRYRVEKKI
ncbi:MAG: hypothetical protein U9R27_07945, partial [Campylobacterota bacterium]|nr:hypothetical protein [Campylobacterota bacterium]